MCIRDRDYVTAYIQISPSGHVTGPALDPQLAEHLNEQKDLYQRPVSYTHLSLCSDIRALVNLPQALLANAKNPPLQKFKA